MSIFAGAVVRSGQRLFVVMDASMRTLALAPVAPVRTPAMAGDVQIDELYAARCASASLSTSLGLEVVGEVSGAVLEACRRAARRNTLTTAVLAKYAKTQEWARGAANELTACR